MIYLGDYAEDATIDFKWSSNDRFGASITRATDGTVKVYKANSTDEVTAPTGITDSEDFDSLTGIHHCRIDTSANAFYATGNDYTVVLSGAVIDGQTVNAVLAHFSIENRFMRGTDGANTTVPDAAGTAATPAEVATALATYDGPTRAEMDAGHGVLATSAGLTTHDNKLAPVSLDDGDATIGGMLTKMVDDNDGADFDAETDSLEAIGDKVTTLGAGATEWTYTLTSTVDPYDPIADADVWVTSDATGHNVIASGTTDANGVVTFYLDDGEVFIWRQKSGWNFDNPDTEVVS